MFYPPPFKTTWRARFKFKIFRNSYKNVASQSELSLAAIPCPGAHPLPFPYHHLAL